MKTLIEKMTNLIFTGIFRKIIVLLILVQICSPQISPQQLHRRFEYKHSFRAPNLAHKDGTITFWEVSGDAIARSEQIRLAPSLRSQKGAVWNIKPMVESEFWEVEMSFKITGQSRIGADGLAFWYTAAKGVQGPVFGSNDYWTGLGIFFDSFDNDNRRDNPIVGMMINDGTRTYTSQNDGYGELLAQCQKDFRNRPFPIKVKIEYSKNVVEVSLTSGMTQDAKYELCIKAENIFLPRSGFFGLSAATGGLADDHDVMSFEAWSLSSIAPAAPSTMPIEEKKKYDEEYQRRQQEYKEEQEKYQKEHPDKVRMTEEEEFAKFEDPLQRTSRMILEAQTHMYNVIQQCDAKLNQIQQQQQQLTALCSQPGQRPPAPAGGAPPVPGVPVDTFQRHEVNEMLQASREMNAYIKEIKNFATDIQNRIMVVDQRLTSSGGVPNQAGGSAYDLEFQKSHLEHIKREVEQIRLAQRTQTQACPTIDSTCLSPMIFIFVIVAQTIIFILYMLLKGRNEKAKFY